jgi:hypothetical protein
MVRLFSRLVRGLSSHSFYLGWTRSSAVFLILQGFFGGSNDSSIASIGLTVVLTVLLASGVLLVVLGIKDLIRDFRRRFLQSH